MRFIHTSDFYLILTKIIMVAKDTSLGENPEERVANFIKHLACCANCENYSEDNWGECSVHQSSVPSTGLCDRWCFIIPER